MITVSSERGLIKIESWEDVVGMAGFSGDVNPNVYKLSAIVGRYVFKTMVPCGLSNCHTPHSRGYIAQTKDGPVTNIGKDCGARYFGVEFETMSRKFDRDLEDQDRRTTLWTFSFQVEELKSRVSELRSSEFGADWVYTKSRSLVQRGKDCPDAIVGRIGTMVKSRSGRITVPRLASKEEREAEEAILRRAIDGPLYIDDHVGEISGLSALYPENDLKQLLIHDLGERLKEFEVVDIESMTSQQLRSWAQWTGSIDSLIERAKASVAAGNQLLTADNLRQLARFVSGDDAQIFRRWLGSLPAKF